MPIRNPFARRPGGPVVNDENLRPEFAADGSRTALPGFERVDTVGSKASSAVSVRSGKSQDNGEYKMSGMACQAPSPAICPLATTMTWFPCRRLPLVVCAGHVIDRAFLQLSTTVVSIFR